MDDDRLRALPSVHELVESLGERAAGIPRPLAVEEARRLLAGLRGSRAEPPADLPGELARRLEDLVRPSLRRVINATGVVLHTNLGRAPLPRFEPIAGYSNLEYDLARGARGKRDVHAGALLERLLGQPGIVVNNNAAAVFLALHELAAGHEAIVSRGELIEIGDGFRIPEIMERSGAVLREVGTTNRTRAGDYRAAINDRTRLILRVHPSNFRIEGFAERPALAELAQLGRERGIPVYEDIGSGCLYDAGRFGLDEPDARASLAAGISLVSFSTDKMLGGPQAGVLAGDPELVRRLRRNPLFRAFRVDKLICQALEATLRNVLLERWDGIPAVRMLALSAAEIRARAEALLPRLEGASLVAGKSVIGGGSTPAQSLDTWLIAIERADVTAFEQRLRECDPPVVARIEGGRLLIDLRTVSPEEEEVLAARLIS